MIFLVTKYFLQWQFVDDPSVGPKNIRWTVVRKQGRLRRRKCLRMTSGQLQSGFQISHITADSSLNRACRCSSASADDLNAVDALWNKRAVCMISWQLQVGLIHTAGVGRALRSWAHWFALVRGKRRSCTCLSNCSHHIWESSRCRCPSDAQHAPDTSRPPLQIMQHSLH